MGAPAGASFFAIVRLIRLGKNPSKLKNRETGDNSSLGQALISADERSLRRTLLTPSQGCRKLKTVRSRQLMQVQNSPSQVPQWIGWKYLPPSPAQQSEAGEGPLFLAICQSAKERA
jgi:hypothetical protein